MIVVRNIFRLKFGKAKEVKAFIPDAIALNKKFGISKSRGLMDLTGDSYTMVFETTYNSLADFETKIQTLFTSSEWQTFYNKLIPFVISANREIFTVIAE